MSTMYYSLERLEVYYHWCGQVYKAMIPTRYLPGNFLSMSNTEVTYVIQKLATEHKFIWEETRCR